MTFNGERSDTNLLSDLPSVEILENSRPMPHVHRYPHCIVWRPIPLLTWLFPIVGHIGICSMEGIIYDFAGSYTIMEDAMLFGWPTMYCQLDLNKITSSESWNRSVCKANSVYRARVHNLLCDNCHSHVALALNEMRYAGRSNWNMATLVLFFFRRARFVSKCACFVTVFPFLCLLGIISTILMIYFVAK